MADCKPRFATKRNKRRRSMVGEVQETAKLLGVVLMWWQAFVLSVALEWKAAGYPFFRIIVLTISRQQGKTVLVGILVTWWAMRFPGDTVVLMAQTREAATERLADIGRRLTAAGVEGVRVYRGSGNEQLVFENGSRVVVESPNAHGGHGSTYALIVLDEAWALMPHTLQGLLPTQTALKRAQLWVVSTQGTEDSDTWNGFVDRGRESLGDPTANVAFFEWSADLDAGDDVQNPEHWVRWMPALGITCEVENILPAIESLSPGEAMRAYGNVLTATDSELFPADWLERGLDAYQSPPERGVVFAFDVNWDPKASSIAAAWETERGWHSEVVAREAGMGSEWLLSELKRLVVKHRPVALASVGGTSAREIQGQIKALAEQYVIPYRVLPNQDYAAACQGFYEGLRTGTVTFGDNESLDNALRRVVVKDTGELWRFDSKASRVDVSPLVACADALFVAREVAARRMQVAIY